MASTILSDNGVTSGSAGLKTTAASDGALALQTTTAGGTATTALTIDTSQNVGIGTSSISASANYKSLNISGTTGAEIYLQTGSTNYGYIYADNGGFRLIAPASGAATGTMQFSTSNTERMRIDNSGNVGIGITPSAFASSRKALQVGGSSTVATLGLSSGIGEVVYNTYYDGTNFKYINTNYAASFDYNNAATGGFAWRLAPSGTAGTNVTLTEAMRIDSSGNLLVGTTDGASSKINTRGIIASSTSQYTWSTFDGYTDGNLYITANAGSSNTTNSNIIFRSSTSGGSVTERMRIDNSGNVGIGTTTPGYPLQVYTSSSSNAATISMVNNATSNTSSLAFVQNGSTTASYSYIVGDGRSSGYMSFATNNTERMRIDSSGNFFVNSTTAGGSGQEKFSVSQSSGNRVAAFVNQTGTSGYSSIFSSIQSSGNNTSTYHFQGNTNGVGNWYLWGNGTTTFSSDQRLKKNIETARDGYLEDLARLRVVKYNWKNDADGTPKELGLIAQDVEEVFAGLVQDDIGQISDEDTTIYKQLKVSVLPFMLLKAIQELKAINDTQAETINALTARIVALEQA